MAGPKPLTDDELQAACFVRIEDALAFCSGEVGDDREKSTRYYRGDISQDLADIPGRSRVVSRDVRDVVLDIMPSLLRVFFAREKAVEFMPRGPEDEAYSQQATDYANFILSSDNNGFRIFHSVFKDALVRRTGVVKVWWENVTRIQADRFEGIDPQTFAMFAAEADASPAEVEITDVEQAEDGKLSFVVTRKRNDGRVKVAAVPPEQFVIARDAVDDERPSLIGHHCEMTVSDLVAMGYDFDEMVDLAGEGEDTDFTGEEDARRFSSDVFADTGFSDPAMRKVEYGEYYILIDADGDGIAEMRKVCTAGPAHKIIMQEMVSDHPFATFCPEPEPHTFFGLSLADCLEDIQLIRSQLLRLALDGLGSVLTPRMGYIEGMVNMRQLQDARPGGLVGVKRADALFPLPTDKAAPQAAMEAFRLMGEIRQDRTGQNQASMGLSADALQSVSRIATNELVQKAQARAEMIVRFFADGMQRVYRLILSLITRFQDQDRIIRLRGKFVPMDPRMWNPDMDVHINVALGNGNPEERAMFLQSFLGVQQQIMQSLPDNPWVGPEEVRNALEDLVEASGRLPDRYVISAEKWQQMQQMKAQQPPKPPKPDPAELLAQVEAQKIQKDMALSERKQQFDMQRELLQDDRERDKLDADIILQAAKLGIPPETTLAFIRQQRAATPSQVM